MGALSNWGLLPTAIVQSVAASSPFNPATDPALGTGESRLSFTSPVGTKHD